MFKKKPTNTSEVFKTWGLAPSEKIVDIQATTQENRKGEETM